MQEKSFKTAMKKVLCVMMSIIMIMSLSFSSSAGFWDDIQDWIEDVDWEEVYNNIPEGVLDDLGITEAEYYEIVAEVYEGNIQVPINVEEDEDGTVYISYCPEETGDYTVETTEEVASITLYNAEFTEIESSDSSYELTTFHLVAGEVYFFGVEAEFLAAFFLNIKYVEGSDEEVEEDEEPELSLVWYDIEADETVTVDLDEYEAAAFEFVPEATGTYTFTSESYGDDTYGILYNGDIEEITYNDDIEFGEDFDFSITYDLEAGETYYYVASYYSLENYGEFDVTLSLDNYIIEEDETITVDINEPEQWRLVKFVPETTGEYVFYSISDEDTYVNFIYDGVREDFDDDGGDGYNFSITQELIAGEEYFYNTTLYQNDATGSFDVTIEKVEEIDEPEEPVLPEEPTTAPTTRPTTAPTTRPTTAPTTRPTTAAPTTAAPTTAAPTTAAPTTTEPEEVVEDARITKIKISSFSIKWDKVEGADSYLVAYSLDGVSWKFKSVEANQLTLKKLKAGTNYIVKVLAINAEGEQFLSSQEISTSTKPAKVTLKSVKSNAKKKMVVKWNKVAGANGYQITYSTSENFTERTTKSKDVRKSKSRLTVKKLRSGATYFVKVRAFKRAGGEKIYGNYSAVKSVEIK